MTNFSNILLASHNTIGAKAADKLAFKLAKDYDASINHLIIVPEFWQWMMGDDWLNNSNTQKEYGDYVESELEREIVMHIEHLQALSNTKKIPYSYKLSKGVPDQELINESENNDYDLIVIGSPRPKGVDGLNSKLLTKSLPIQLSTPLLIVPFPT